MRILFRYEYIFPGNNSMFKDSFFFSKMYLIFG